MAVYNIVAAIEIDGTAISNYYSLQIKQRFNEHHEFTVKLPYDVIEEEQLALNKVKNSIGKVIIIRLVKGADQKVQNEFKGIITEVGIEQYDAYHSQIILKGFSPTIMLEGGPHLNCFFEKNLKKIFTDTATDVSSECKMKINPSNTSEIKYLTQYKESNFEFLNRLSSEYGEWFYYDGKELFFGKPSSSKDIELISGEDVTGLQLKLQLLPLDAKAVSYYDQNNTIVSGATPGSVSGLGEFGPFAATESSKIFSKVSGTGTRPKAENASDLTNALTIQKSAAASRLEVVSGTSTNPEIILGATATISISKRTETDFEKQEHGKFVITGVTHEISEDGKYKNHFEGLPASIKVVPVKNVKKPFAETQVGHVTDNKDPDKLGRVKVKMLWQESVITDWIRVVTSNGGEGGKTGKNRGFIFIPEVNDQVLVGFTYNDPDWPFVLGSVLHGKSATGGGDNNSVKTLGTKSGHTITFNDDEKSLLIEDAKGNLINFDGKGKIIVESSDNIELKCGQSSIVMAKDGSITIKGAKISIEGSSELKMKAPNVSAKGDATLKLEGANVSAKADASLKLDGAMVAVKGSATVSVEGAMAKLAGSGMAEITGAIVKIN